MTTRCFSAYITDEFVNYLNEQEYRTFREMVGPDFLDDDYVTETQSNNQETPEVSENDKENEKDEE